MSPHHPRTIGGVITETLLISRNTIPRTLIVVTGAILKEECLRRAGRFRDMPRIIAIETNILPTGPIVRGKTDADLRTVVEIMVGDTTNIATRGNADSHDRVPV